MQVFKTTSIMAFSRLFPVLAIMLLSRLGIVLGLDNTTGKGINLWNTMDVKSYHTFDLKLMGNAGVLAIARYCSTSGTTYCLCLWIMTSSPSYPTLNPPCLLLFLPHNSPRNGAPITGRSCSSPMRPGGHPELLYYMPLRRDAVLILCGRRYFCGGQCGEQNICI